MLHLDSGQRRGGIDLPIWVRAPARRGGRSIFGLVTQSVLTRFGLRRKAF
ncbi:hypothetical protein [Nocardia brasiliensis]|nr:hypothetical protein [Nocardia brasiliensis]